MRVGGDRRTTPFRTGKPFWGFFCFWHLFVCSGRALCVGIHLEIECRESDVMRMVFLCLGLLLWGCAIAKQVKVSSEVFDATNAKKRSVAVVADLYMEDPTEAAKLAQLIGSQLTANGFKIQETEETAELVVIPTIERSKPGSENAIPSPRLRRAWRSLDLAYSSTGSQMTESQNALRNLGFDFEAAPSPVVQSKVGLVVTAVTREAWFNASPNQKTEIPKVWRIIAVTVLENEDITPRLVQAVGSKFAEVAREQSSHLEKRRSSPPRPSPRKKPAREP
jgi:hypothetical protein